MKRILVILLAFALAFCVASCSNRPSQPSTNEPEILVPEEPDDETGNGEQTPPEPDPGEEPEPDIPEPPIDPDPGEEDPPPPPEEDPFVDIAGYVKRPGRYTYATDFFGAYAYAERDGLSFLIDRNGAETPCNNLRDLEIRQDKYVIVANGGLELRKVTGEVLLGGDYTKIEFDGDTILAFTESQCYIYEVSDLAVPVSVADSVQVTIVRDGYLRIDGKAALYDRTQKLYSFSYTDPVLGGTTKYQIASPENNGVITIYKKGNYGYAAVDGSWIVDAQYIQAAPFCDGFGVVSDLRGYNLVYDDRGEIVYEGLGEMGEDGYTPIYYQSGYTLLKNGGSYCTVRSGIITRLEFAPLNERIYNGYLVHPDGKIYSLATGEYIPAATTAVIPQDEYFICKTSNGVCLWDMDLREFFSGATDIRCGRGWILIEQDGRFAYYNKITL